MQSNNSISTDQLARELRKTPETIRRMCRRGEIPFTGGGRGQEYKFDRVKVFETFVKKDIVHSLNNILEDPALPRVIRNNITEMVRGIQNGLLSVEQVGQLMHAMEA